MLSAIGLGRGRPLGRVVDEREHGVDGAGQGRKTGLTALVRCVQVYWKVINTLTAAMSRGP
jgi:hypothetical protein